MRLAYSGPLNWKTMAVSEMCANWQGALKFHIPQTPLRWKLQFYKFIANNWIYKCKNQSSFSLRNWSYFSNFSIFWILEIAWDEFAFHYTFVANEVEEIRMCRKFENVVWQCIFWNFSNFFYTCPKIFSILIINRFPVGIFAV